MKQTVLCALASAALLTAATADDADARPRPKAGRKFVANKTFGIGAMIGVPTGLSGKWFYGRSTAIDFGLGVYRGWRDHDGFNLHVDHLWHPVSIVSVPAFELPLYVGIGGRVLDFDTRNDVDYGTALGVRVPLGVAFDFNEIPLDAFIELALVVDMFIDVPGDDDFDADLNLSLGARYWF